MHNKLQELMEKRPSKDLKGNQPDEYSAYVASLIGKKAKLKSDFLDPEHHTYIENEKGEIVEHPKKGKPREVLYPKGSIMTIERVARDSSVMLHTGEIVTNNAQIAIWLHASQIELID